MKFRLEIEKLIYGKLPKITIECIESMLASGIEVTLTPKGDGSTTVVSDVSLAAPIECKCKKHESEGWADPRGVFK